MLACQRRTARSMTCGSRVWSDQPLAQPKFRRRVRPPGCKTLARPQPGELARSHPADGDGKKAPRDSEAEERVWRTDPSDGLRPLLATRRRLARVVA